MKQATKGKNVEHLLKTPSNGIGATNFCASPAKVTKKKNIAIEASKEKDPSAQMHHTPLDDSYGTPFDKFYETQFDELYETPFHVDSPKEKNVTNEEPLERSDELEPGASVEDGCLCGINTNTLGSAWDITATTRASKFTFSDVLNTVFKESPLPPNVKKEENQNTWEPRNTILTLHFGFFGGRLSPYLGNVIFPFFYVRCSGHLEVENTRY